MGNTDLRWQDLKPGQAEGLRACVPEYQEAHQLSRKAQALADSNRVTLLAFLVEAGRDLSVSDLCLLSEREQSGVSRNLRILWDAGLVERTRWNYLVYYKPTRQGERLLAALLDNS